MQPKHRKNQQSLESAYFLGSGRPMEIIWRTRESRGVRRISGVVYSWNSSYSFSLNSRKHTPGPVLPGDHGIHSYTSNLVNSRKHAPGPVLPGDHGIQLHLQLVMQHYNYDYRFKTCKMYRKRNLKRKEVLLQTAWHRDEPLCSPARPLRCSALARLIQNSCRRCILYLGSKLISFTLPESTINRTPSIVTDVSAMLVDTMHFLTPSGAMSKTYNQSAPNRFVIWLVLATDTKINHTQPHLF